MKFKSSKVLFICQLTEKELRVVKSTLKGRNREFNGFEIEAFSGSQPEEMLAERVQAALRKLSFSHNSLILSLPRLQATARYMKVPSSSAQEIERIVQLQAAHYLPYSSQELSTGYQVIEKDKEGYSYINLIIAHKEAIERYTKIFKELKPQDISIVLSSFGLVSLYSYLRPKESNALTLLDIDKEYIELAVVKQEKLLFSRSFKIPDEAKKAQIVNEIIKTREAFQKETKESFPARIVLSGCEKSLSEYEEVMRREENFSVERLDYVQELKLNQSLVEIISASGFSLAAVLGLALRQTEDSVNLLSKELKEETRKVSKKKESFRLALFAGIVILTLSFAFAKQLSNKANYLNYLKQELSRIEREAKPLEEIERKFKLMRQQVARKPSSLDILYELHKLIPIEVSLTNLNFEQEGRVIIRGQAPIHRIVFDFVSRLEKSAVFKDFEIKIRHATQKKAQNTQIIDFEIICARK